MTLQSIIKYYGDDHSNKNFTKIDSKIDQLVDTHTSDENKGKITDTDSTKVNSRHKLLKKREIPAIFQGVIMPVNQTAADGVATSERVLHGVHVILHKEIITGVTRSAASFLKDPLVENWRDASGPIPQDRNTIKILPRATT